MYCTFTMIVTIIFHPQIRFLLLVRVRGLVQQVVAREGALPRGRGRSLYVVSR